MLRSTRSERRIVSRFRNHSRDGFSLVEVLVALGVTAISLAAIGSLMAANVRGARAIEQHLALLETARAIETSLDDRAGAIGEVTTGELNGHRWRLTRAPFTADFIDPGVPTTWLPVAVVLTVQAPSGLIARINAVRLQRRVGG